VMRELIGQAQIFTAVTSMVKIRLAFAKT